MREGARKWKGPLVGLVFIRFCRKRSYFIFWRTRPPEMVISSARTITYAMQAATRMLGRADRVWRNLMTLPAAQSALRGAGAALAHSQQLLLRQLPHAQDTAA